MSLPRLNLGSLHHRNLSRVGGRSSSSRTSRERRSFYHIADFGKSGRFLLIFRRVIFKGLLLGKADTPVRRAVFLRRFDPDRRWLANGDGCSRWYRWSQLDTMIGWLDDFRPAKPAASWRSVTARWPSSITDQEMRKFGLELSPTPSMARRSGTTCDQ